MNGFLVCATLLIACVPATVQAQTLRIVVWNIENATESKISIQKADIQRLGNDLDPDVLVLQEVSGGEIAAQAIAAALGWPDAYIAVSDFFPPNSKKPYFSQELAVISRVPIVSAIEFDARPDGNTVSVLLPGGAKQPVSEKPLSADGISGFGGGISRYSKGTIRVDLEGGISLFPIHLKSDWIAAKSPGKITETRVKNAKKREITIAAISREASKSVKDGRITVILGDFNTTFEPGKFGAEVADCQLQDFPRTPAPFPPSACSGPGYDDTLGILEAGLVEKQHWSFLTRKLGRTWFGASNRYGDFSIDHVAVPVEQSDLFGVAVRANERYGSDHWPIVFEMQIAD
jgi:endonuclease/exonuclease/phosphatase family metal-dependent hydrolase